jgi:hypothetical protein
LKGLNQLCKPTVALDGSAEAPTLRMIWTGNNDRLSRALCERPPISTPASFGSESLSMRRQGSQG